MAEEVFEKHNWLVIMADGQRYLARIRQLEVIDIFMALKDRGYITAEEAYEYPIFAEQAPNGGFRKIPIPNGVDMQLSPSRTFFVNVSRITFLKDLDEEDAKLIERFVTEVRKAQRAQKLQRSSGITIAKP